MNFSFPTRRVKEGVAEIFIPDLSKVEGRTSDQPSSNAPVFYNPRMKMNRDTAVLALCVHHVRLSRRLRVCEPMCGTGVRGLRIALEVDGVESVVMGDLNPYAVRLAEENVAANGVSSRVRARLMDANLLLSMHDRPWARFDYIDLDPYGSPAPYLDSAVRACRSGGMVALTATDMAPLCGVNPKACLRKYGGLPLRTEYCHEVALRLVAGILVKVSARHGTAAHPVFGYAADHYVRLYAVLNRGARDANRCLDGVGYLLHCFKCNDRRPATVDELGEGRECEVCGSKMSIGGPLWLGDCSDREFCDAMLSLSERSLLYSDPRLVNLIRLVGQEIGFGPTFYDIDQICSMLKTPSLPTDEVVSAIRDAGYRVTRTNFDERGLKTEASIVELKNIIKSLIR